MLKGKYELSTVVPCLTRSQRETLVVVRRGMKDDKIVISSREKRGIVIIVVQVILLQYLLHAGNFLYFIIEFFL